MAQVLHQRAKTTHAIRKDIQRSSASVAELSRRYNLNPKTVRKWRRRSFAEDERMDPKQPSSTSLSDLEEAAAITFRLTTWLALDDCLFALQRFFPHLTRSSLHRLYWRHDISQLPRQANEATDKSSFKHYPIGYLHMDICEVRTGEARRICSWPSTAPPSLCMPGSIARHSGNRRLSSSKTCYNSCRIGFTPY